MSRRRFLMLPLFLAALRLASPQSYYVTEDQLRTLEEESRARKEELQAQESQLRELNLQLERLSQQLEISERELASSLQALEESGQALKEAKESLKRYAGRSLRGKILAAAASLVVGAAGGIAAGYFLAK